ncbi:MAG: aldo/keto reductase [Eubacteriales bacterium]|nr:aldo/keto reductase [Eubacteriales bacterium]
MRYKKLGKSGVEVSTLTIGTWAMGGVGYGPVEKKSCIDAIRAMVDQGVNHIDTAWVYGLGESDKLVGEAIKGIRDKVLITTKCGFRNPADGGANYPDCSPEWITWCFEESLRNLGTDYVDFFLVHVPDEKVPYEVTAECVNKWIKEGKVRYAGVSNFGINDTKAMGQYLDITANQCGYSMVNRAGEEDMKWALANGIGIETHSSLANGILTGAIRELPHYPADDIRNIYPMYQHLREPMFSKCMELLKTLDKIAEERGVPVAQISLNWNTQKDFVTTSLCGVRNVKEAVENCKSTEWELTAEEMAEIDQAIGNTLEK